MFLDAALYAACAAALSRSARSFRLYNLAAGSWIVVGGWCASWIAGLWTGVEVPVRPWLFLVFGLLAALQILLPRFVRSGLYNSPLPYLLCSLGIALSVNNLGPDLLLSAHGSTIPFEGSDAGSAVCVLLMIVIIGGITVFGDTQAHARSVLRFRAHRSSDRDWASMSNLLLLEILLLLMLGAAGMQGHKGVFGAAEYRTVIPLLAVVAGSAHPLTSALLALILALATHALNARIPLITGYAAPITILLLAGLSVARARPWPWVLKARSLGCVTPRSEAAIWPPGRLVLGALVLMVLTAIGCLAAGAYPVPSQRAVWLGVLATTAWLSVRHLGVLSVGWVAPGVLSIYAALMAQEFLAVSFWPAIVGCAALIATVWALYLLVLRALSPSIALLVDLSALVCLHHYVLSSTTISGAENVRALGHLLPSDTIAMACIGGQSLMAGALFILAFFAAEQRTARAGVLALVNPAVGLQHGLPSGPLFFTAALGLGGVAIVSTIGYHSVQPILTPSQLSLGLGLGVALFGELMYVRGPGLGYVGVALFFGVLQAVMVGTGTYMDTALGMAFVLVAYASRVRIPGYAGT